MHVSRSTFGHLLDFVDRFPGYFLGCNAALPRIGGSVLAHDHYQGGGELLPMHKACRLGDDDAAGIPGRDHRDPRLARHRRARGRQIARHDHRGVRQDPRRLDQLLQPRAGHHLRRRGRQALRGVAQRDHHRARLRNEPDLPQQLGQRGTAGRHLPHASSGRSSRSPSA